MLNNLLSIQKLSFSYYKKLILNNVNFSINNGEILGLLGPNGAGKTTFFKLLSGFLKIQHGNIFFKNTIIGKPGKCIKSKFRAILGVVFQECSLDNKITTIENLKFSGKIYGLKGERLNNLITESIKTFGLTTQKDVKVKKLSGGMKKRLELARAMLHNPQLLLLDEPTVGLDEKWRKIFLNKLKRTSNSGLSAIISTHRLDEAENCNRLLVIHKGKILLICTPDELKAKVSNDKLLIRINQNISKIEINNNIKKLNNHFSLRYLKFFL